MYKALLVKDRLSRRDRVLAQESFYAVARAILKVLGHLAERGDVVELELVVRRQARAHPLAARVRSAKAAALRFIMKWPQRRKGAGWYCTRTSVPCFHISLASALWHKWSSDGDLMAPWERLYPHRVWRYYVLTSKWVLHACRPPASAGG